MGCRSPLDIFYENMHNESIRTDWWCAYYMVNQMQEKIDEQDKEIQRLKTLLSQNGIDEEKNE